MCLFGETYDASTREPSLLATPVAYDATPGGPNNHYQGLAQQAQKGLLPTPRAIYGEHPGMSHPSHLTGMALTSSPQATPASHSHSPGSAWARKMTVISGRKFADYWLKSDPVDACLRTLLGTSIWASMTCYLTWKRSATPAGRLLFRLVPSTPRTGGIGSGFSPLWGTPTSRDYKDTGDQTNVPVNGLLGRQDLATEQLLPTPMNADAIRSSKAFARGNPTLSGAAHLLPTPRAEFDSGRHRGKPDTLHSAVKLWPPPTEHGNYNRKGLSANSGDGLATAVAETLLPTPRASESELRSNKRTPSQQAGKHGKYLSVEAGQTPGLKLNSAWVSRMMGYPDDWLTVDGETTP